MVTLSLSVTFRTAKHALARFRPLGNKQSSHRAFPAKTGIQPDGRILAEWSVSSGVALSPNGDVLAISTKVASSPVDVCMAGNATLPSLSAEIILSETGSVRQIPPILAFEGTWQTNNQKTKSKHLLWSGRLSRYVDEISSDHIHRDAILKTSVDRICFSPDGKRMVALGTDGAVPSAARQIKWWDLVQGTEMSPPVKGVWPEAFSDDGRYVASQSEKSTKLWDTKSGRELSAMEGTVGAFTPDGKRLAVFVGNTVNLLDTSTGNRVLSLQAGGEVRRIAFSPDGSWMAALESQGTVSVWKSATPDNPVEDQ